MSKVHTFMCVYVCVICVHAFPRMLCSYNAIGFNYIACPSFHGYRTVNAESVRVYVLSPIAFGFLPVVHHLSTGFICKDKYGVVLCFSSATVNDSDSFHI